MSETYRKTASHVVSGAIIYSPNISALSRCLWIVLKTYVSPSDSMPFPSFDILCQHMSSLHRDKKTGRVSGKPMSKPALRRCLRELTDAGFLAIERSKTKGERKTRTAYALIES